MTPVHGPSPVEVKPLVPDEMREILWSEEKGVPENILARPHTSNPRYVEMHMRDTPRKDNNSADGTQHAVPSAGATNTTPSSEHNSALPPQQPEGILWACGDSDSIDPALLVRPVTANPWLTRLFESGLVAVEDVLNHRGSKILWSSNDIEDWRSLARPHTSNPHREREQETSEQDAVVGEATHTAPAAPNVSEVLWAREDPEELRSTVEAQGRRIMNLEEEVSSLKQILFEVIAKLGGQAAPETAASAKSEPASMEGLPARDPPAAANRSQAAVSPSLATTKVITTNSIPIVTTPMRQTASGDHDGFVVEDISAVEPQLLGPETPTVLRPTAPPGPARPDTASASRRVLELRETVGQARPQSAPLSHYTEVKSRKRDVVNCFSGEGFSANHLDNSAITTEYSRLLRSGHDLVLRHDFKEHYTEKASEMGMFVSKAEVDRKFGNSPLYLTLEEFAIHYLRIARW
jgi:hypothetical protein